MRCYRKKNQSFFLLLIVLMLGIGVGYALLTSTLNIIGSTTLASSTWDIHFDNLQVIDGSVSLEEGDVAASIDQNNNTLVNYAVTLSLPGDFYEFTVDVVNAGTIDGMVSVVTSKLNNVVIDAEHPVPDYLKYSVKYEDGVEIEESHLLAAGESETYKIRVEFDSEITGDNLPNDTQTLSFNFGVTYVQADDTAVERENHNLYSVLKKAAKEGTYARKYTRAHQDSYAGTGTKDIYHWYATSDANGTAILDKNNVIFAGQCWQMIRTTDTGGVKMIYNGEVVNNQCLNNRGNHVGYAKRTTQSMSTTYYYGTSYTYDSTNSVFSLSGTVSTGEIKTGEYTCKSTSETGTCATLYYVDNISSGTTYYVIPLNSNSHYSQFGTLQFNQSSDSVSYVGYMYNNVYRFATMNLTSVEAMTLSSYLTTTFWYADSVVWGSPIANKYNLVNPYQISSTSDYPSLVGKYTFSRKTQDYTNTNVFYIDRVDSSTMYYIKLDESGNHTLSDFNYSYTYGDSYIDNGNGTYTVTNTDNSSPTTVYRIDWDTSYSSVGTKKYVCKNAMNNTCSDLWYITNTSANSMTYLRVANVIKFAKGFTWDGSKYILNNENSVSYWNANSTISTINNSAHYTCWNEIGECTTISYFYGRPYFETPLYISITNGKSEEDALDEMLYDNRVNSVIKNGVDLWYKRYILGVYDDYIEDTIFCNDRSISSLGGWNSDGGNPSGSLKFEGYTISKDLSCANETDRFSVANNSAKLSYKVGLMSSPEMNILGNNNARKTGSSYWLISPKYIYYDHAIMRYVYSSGKFETSDDSSYTNKDYGVRPAISLKPGTIYSSGDGSMANPYVVE